MTTRVVKVVLISPLVYSADAPGIRRPVRRRGLRQREGTKIYSTGHKYVGEFKNGMRDGEGAMAMPGGRTLKGRFERDAIFQGTYTDPDGSVYTGTWEFRERNGRGTLKYPDGRVYEGTSRAACATARGP